MEIYLKIYESAEAATLQVVRSFYDSLRKLPDPEKLTLGMGQEAELLEKELEDAGTVCEVYSGSDYIEVKHQGTMTGNLYSDCMIVRLREPLTEADGDGVLDDRVTCTNDIEETEGVVPVDMTINIEHLQKGETVLETVNSEEDRLELSTDRLFGSLHVKVHSTRPDGESEHELVQKLRQSLERISLQSLRAFEQESRLIYASHLQGRPRTAKSSVH